MSDPWLKSLDAEIRGGLKQKLRQQTDGTTTILTPRTDFQSFRKPSNFIPPNGETVTETITATVTQTVTVDTTQTVTITVTDITEVTLIVPTDITVTVVSVTEVTVTAVVEVTVTVIL